MEGTCYLALCLVLLPTVIHCTRNDKCHDVDLPKKCQLEDYSHLGLQGCSLLCKILDSFPSIGKWGSDLLRIVILYSNIRKLTEEAFENSTNLRVVIMHYCVIRYVGYKTFTSLQHLDYLSLAWNPIRVTELTNVMCSIPQNAPVSLVLKGLYLRKMNGSFPDAALKCLRFSNISNFDFSVNAVSSDDIRTIFCSTNGNLKNISFRAVTQKYPLNVNKTFFQCLTGTSIRYLNLAENGLTEMSPDSFSYLSNLKNLDLSTCEIAIYMYKYSLDIFSELLNLELLQLRRNNFRDFSVFARPYKQQLVLSNLRYLDLSENSFWFFERISRFSALKNLRTLIINNNLYTLGRIPQGFIANLTKLKSLVMNENTIYLMNDKAFQSDSLEHLELRRINVQISQVHTTIFRHATNLKSIGFDGLNGHRGYQNGSHKALEHFLGQAFRNLKQLRSLTLSKVNMYNIQSGMFTGTDKLEFLDLSSNYISVLFRGALKNQIQLTTLNLDSNEIHRLNKTSLPVTRDYLNLSLSNNPWSCDCSLYWFCQLLTRNKSDNSKVILVNDSSQYVCSSPSYMAGRLLIDYCPKVKKCNADSLTGTYYILVYVSSSQCLIILIISTIYRFRWYIYYIYVNTSARARGYKEMNDVTNYGYDAFVSYNKDDRVWVVNLLRNVLETKNQFKLCLHDRDWLGGVDIVDNIQQSIERSRKVVLIITNAFARSNWCQLELTMAQHRLFSEDKDNLILVMKEKILDCYMTPRLALQLKTQTYIEWDESEMGQKVFWKRLVKAISGPGRSVKNRHIN